MVRISPNMTATSMSVCGLSEAAGPPLTGPGLSYQGPLKPGHRAFRSATGVARNDIADQHRRRRPEASFEDALAHPSDMPGPDQIAVSTDDARRLRAAIGRLTPLQQDVVVLRFLEDRSNKEIAAITGKPEATIRGIQMRALAALRDLLRAEVAR